VNPPLRHWSVSSQNRSVLSRTWSSGFEMKNLLDGVSTIRFRSSKATFAFSAESDLPPPLKRRPSQSQHWLRSSTQTKRAVRLNLHTRQSQPLETRRRSATHSPLTRSFSRHRGRRMYSRRFPSLCNQHWMATMSASLHTVRPAVEKHIQWKDH